MRVGDDGVHEFVVRGGDAGEVYGDVVLWLEEALAVGAQLLGDRDQGIVADAWADVAEAGSLGAVVAVVGNERGGPCTGTDFWLWLR